MKLLPGVNYTLCGYKYFLHVPNNYHLEYDGHYYSVPYRYLKEPAVLKATISEVRICDKNNTLICRHTRSYKTFPLYITEENHMPANHQYYKELNSKDGAYYRRWASVYGEYMEILVDRILRSAKHEEQAYNSCNGILHSCKNISHTIVEEAAERCVKANACKYTYFKKVLNTVRNERYGKCQTGQMPLHEKHQREGFLQMMPPKDAFTKEELQVTSRLRQMKLSGMADALENQLRDPNADLAPFIVSWKRKFFLQQATAQRLYGRKPGPEAVPDRDFQLQTFFLPFFRGQRL